jgi:hypothetical protein
MESAESDVGLSGLFTLYCHVVMYFSEQGIIRVKCETEWFIKVNKPLSPTSDSADSMLTKLQYYMTGQGK